MGPDAPSDAFSPPQVAEILGAILVHLPVVDHQEVRRLLIEGILLLAHYHQETVLTSLLRQPLPMERWAPKGGGHVPEAWGPGWVKAIYLNLTPRVPSLQGTADPEPRLPKLHHVHLEFRSYRSPHVLVVPSGSGLGSPVPYPRGSPFLSCGDRAFQTTGLTCHLTASPKGICRGPGGSAAQVL